MANSTRINGDGGRAAAEAETECPRCGSTERSPYLRPVERAIACTDAAGQPATHVIWRRTQCRGCGQWRIDKHFENRPAPVVPEVDAAAGAAGTIRRGIGSGGKGGDFFAATAALMRTAAAECAADDEPARKSSHVRRRVNYL